MYKAIIFDFYGVIRSDEYHNWLDRHNIARGSKLKKLSRNLDLGQSSLDQFFQGLSKLSGIPAEDISKEFLTHSNLNEPLLNLVLQLKKKYKIAILSNANSNYLKRILKDSGVDVLFDEIITSSELGYIKPDQEIFDHAIEKLGVKTDQAIFIDDNQSFCQAAEDLGIKSIYYQDFDSLLSKFKEIGIIDN